MEERPFRVKDSPEDFRVAELSDFPMTGGPFAVYTLRKRDVGTLEALDELRPLLGNGFVSFGGLKDKYAVTEQFVAVEFGPRQDLRSAGAELEYMNQAERPFESRDVKANRFSIVLRDLAADVRDRLEANLASAGEWWTPNYFDEQRFGSLGESGVFVAQPWCNGDYEQAVRIALTDPNPHDESNDRFEKRLLKEHWNAWQELPRLRDPVRDAVVSHLAYRPKDFRGAITRIPHGRRTLYLSAFQSALWNRLLAADVDERLAGAPLHRFSVANASLPMPSAIESAEFLADRKLPFPTARTPLQEGPVAERMADVLGNYGLEYRQLRVKYPRDTFFSKGERAAGFQPVDLRWTSTDDDRYPGRRKLTLEFDLARGCYATMFIRRLEASLPTSDVAADRKDRGGFRRQTP
jgi:tRNA pseudouridine13 synthase